MSRGRSSARPPHEVKQVAEYRNSVATLVAQPSNGSHNNKYPSNPAFPCMQKSALLRLGALIPATAIASGQFLVGEAPNGSD